jgi:RNA recognition motif-containing protein
MTISIANLSFNAIDSDLRKLFSAFGDVNSAVIVRDKLNGRSRGTGFVDMNSSIQGAQAISSLHNSTFDGKRISVSAVEYDPSEFKN